MYLEPTSPRIFKEIKHDVYIDRIVLSENRVHLYGRDPEHVRDENGSVLRYVVRDIFNSPTILERSFINQLQARINKFVRSAQEKELPIKDLFNTATISYIGKKVDVECNDWKWMWLSDKLQSPTYIVDGRHISNVYKIDGLLYDGVLECYDINKYQHKFQQKVTDSIVDDLVSLLGWINVTKSDVMKQKTVDKIQAIRRSKDEGSLYRNISLKFNDATNRLEWDGMEEGESFEMALVRTFMAN